MLGNHKSVLTSYGLDPKDDELDLPYIYWIPKMKKKIPINIDPLPFQPSVPPSLYPFFLQNCLEHLKSPNINNKRTIKSFDFPTFSVHLSRSRRPSVRSSSVRRLSSLTFTFSTPPLKPLNGIQWNLTGSKISMPSTKFVFFGQIGKTRWPPWPLIG